MVQAALLISSCDKFSDLWDEHLSHLKKHWKGRNYKTYLVTDKPTDRLLDSVEIIVAGEDKDFPMRIKYAVSKIAEDYILLTLDDYFLIHDVNVKKLEYLLSRSEKEHISYLKLYDRRMTDPKKYQSVKKLLDIDLNKKYAITLYPAIWDKDFLYNSVKKDMTPWAYEPSLTKYAREVHAVCKFSHAGLFIILDVVRKGKVLHKANRYFKKNGINIGNRPIIGWNTEAKLAIMDRISWYMPRSIFREIKKIATRFGMKFYSED